MADFPTFQDLFRIARDEALSKNANLTREVIDRDGTDANAFMAAIAAVGDEVVGQLGSVAAGLFLDSARGSKLDRLIFDRFGLLRKSASPAVGSVEFSTTIATTGSFNIPKDTRLQTLDGKQFLTTTAAFFPSGSTGPITVAVRSSQAGLNQQAAIGTINSLLDVITGAPTDLVVTNTVATTGADDEELAESYIDRARRFFQTTRRGTVSAIEAAALNVAGVRTAKVFEAVDEFGRPAQFVQLAIADAFVDTLANLEVVPPTYEAQSQLLAQQVFLALSDTRPAGIFVDVRVAQVILQGVQLGLSFEAGVDVDSVALQARAQVVSTINGLPPGTDLNPANLISALRRVSGLVVTGGEILSPAGIITVQPLQVIRTALGLVVASTVQPDQALQGSANPDAV